eukprot:scaffold91996_cov63-Phaeocystis_antarctica.AAC.1
MRASHCLEIRSLRYPTAVVLSPSASIQRSELRGGGPQAPTAGNHQPQLGAARARPLPRLYQCRPPSCCPLSQLTRLPHTRCHRRHCLPRRSSLTCPAQRGQGRGSVSLGAARAGAV